MSDRPALLRTFLSRRQLLQGAACGFGSLALADLCHRTAASETGLPPLHHAARAKRIIFLFMYGGPSQVDTFDPKPRLQRDDGLDAPFELPPRISAKPKLLGSPWKFARHGQSGLWVSDLLPHTAKLVDDLCVIRSLHSRGQSHGQAVSMLHTGSDNLVRPSLGSWISYGLGPENADLPAFVSINPPRKHGGTRNFGPAFLPAKHQGTPVEGRTPTIAYLEPPASRAGGRQRGQLDLLQQLNRRHLERSGPDARIEGVIESFELAYRMQAVAPEVLDLQRESPATRDLYGIDQEPTDPFGRQCLLARRMAEAGVRFIQVSTGYTWDQHSNLKKGHEKNALETDKPVAGLLVDLKQRGLLEDTLVLWGGEFGRTPMVQGKDGRDHNPQGFTMWLAGGGVQGGVVYGQTDDYGHRAVEGRVHMHDLHATLLHLLGLDHERLTYRYAGRDFRLTDVHGHVVQDIFA